MEQSTKRDARASPRSRAVARSFSPGGTSSGMSHFSRSARQQTREHRRLACDRRSHGNLIDEQQHLQPARSRRPCPSLRASARQRARSPQGRDWRAAAFASKNGAFAPETWDPDGAASLPFLHERCCRTTARKRPLKLKGSLKNSNLFSVM